VCVCGWLTSGPSLSCRATADTFDAAATFYTVLKAWGELDAVTLDKIKFAKWNATRILRACREGKDPNESNPVRSQQGGEGGEGGAGDVALDADDPEVRMLMDAAAAALSGVDAAGGATTSATPFQASVEDADTDVDMLPPHAMSPVIASAPAVVSPTISVASMALDESSGGGGLGDGGGGGGGSMALPSVPGGGAEPPFAPSPMSQSPGLGPAGDGDEDEDVPALLPPAQQQQQQQKQFAPSRPFSSGSTASSSSAAAPRAAAAVAAAAPPQQPRAQPHMPPARAPAALRAAHPQKQPAAGTYQCDEAEIALAQKHAKWAISALNFDDVATAVKNLREALAMLGASS
jgi:vacuolar protein sorting-associated protein VTA1